MIVGCMSSGKSGKLTRLLGRAKYAHLPAYGFRPALDAREAESIISSRDGDRHDAMVVASAGEILSRVGTGAPGIVGIDEVQFFGPDIVPAVSRLIDLGYEVICCGLDTDFRGEPFGSVPQLLAVADEIEKVAAVCVRCRARNANRSQRLIDGRPAPRDAPIILVGGEEFYEPRCRNCHEVPDA
jgi:thymidine kinase